MYVFLISKYLQGEPPAFHDTYNQKAGPRNSVIQARTDKRRVRSACNTGIISTSDQLSIRIKPAASPHKAARSQRSLMQQCAHSRMKNACGMSVIAADEYRR